MSARLFHFAGGPAGAWSVLWQSTLRGDPLPAVPRLAVRADVADVAHGAHGADVAGTPSDAWTLRGITSNDRYLQREERDRLVAVQEGLGRSDAVRASLIPIRKTAAWWALTQAERREIVEEQSNHIAVGLRYLPAIARRLHHCRDLSAHEPFDFLTWFEFAPEHEAAFDHLLAELRATREWDFVDREVELRLSR